MDFGYHAGPKVQQQANSLQLPAPMKFVRVLERPTRLGEVSARHRSLRALEPRLGRETPDSPFHGRSLGGSEVGAGLELLDYEQGLLAVGEGVRR